MGTGYLATLFRRYARLGVLMAVLPGYVLSQETRPKFQIVAFVFDPSGAVVQGATVQVQSISTAIKFRGPTNVAGEFRIQLEAGQYTVSVTQVGFKPLTQQIEVANVEYQRFSLVLEIDSRFSEYLGPCCFGPDSMPKVEIICEGECNFYALPFETEMATLSSALVPPPSPVVPPLKSRDLRRDPITRFFSALRRGIF